MLSGIDIKSVRYFVSIIMLVLLSATAQSQLPRLNSGQLPGMNNRATRPPGGDSISFKHRNDLADSITINLRYLDSLNYQPLDSTINDFGRFYPLKTGYVSIGGDGNPSFPVLFTPVLEAGWDPGFHAYDIYKYHLEDVPFYHTTRPFTSMNYYQGTGLEQIIKVLHTQNIKPYWNAAADFRLISSPGLFQNQNAKDNNYSFTSFYQGKRKRYAAEAIVIGNKLIGAENGGITDKGFLADPNRKRRIAVPVNLGDNSGITQRIFSSNLNVGNKEDDFQVFFRHRYDLGKRDSIAVNDSTTEYLFYPKLRFQHTIHYQKSSYQFIDNLTSLSSNITDSIFFKERYDIDMSPNTTSFYFLDEWKYLSNDFSIRQFPDTKNQRQFLEGGVRFENYTGDFTKPLDPYNILIVNPKPPDHRAFNNIVVHGEYRNKTKNRKWDMFLNGEFYLAGFYTSDYSAHAALQRYLNPKLGSIEVSFDNISRSPSYIFLSGSAFNLDNTSLSKKENITILGFKATNNRFHLMVRNMSIANYAYFSSFYQKDQYSGLINLTQATFSIKNKVSKFFNLYSDFIVQQTAGNNPVKVPLVYTRQRFAFEGNFFKNFNVSTGLDVRYNTPYKANNYSPITGQFFPQDTAQISNLPEIGLFLNFRIKYFTAFLTVKNLNTIDPQNGFSFTNNSFAAPYYPTPGFMFMVGIKWDMVN